MRARVRAVKAAAGRRTRTRARTFRPAPAVHRPARNCAANGSQRLAAVCRGLAAVCRGVLRCAAACS
eukprot:2172141-Alexandrium_andersonii.AAC.1